MGGIITWYILFTTFLGGVVCQRNVRDLNLNGFEQTQMRYPENPEKLRELATIYGMIQNAAAYQRAQQRSHAMNIITNEESEVPSELTGNMPEQDENSNNMVQIPIVQIPLSMIMQNRGLQNKIQQQEYTKGLQSLIPQEYELGRPEKRGSYIALCHFKICNMGRKRTASKIINPWSRNDN